MLRRCLERGRVGALQGIFIGILLGITGSLSAQVATPPKDKPDLLALPESKPIHGMGWPALSPDGKSICFTYLGDLWTVSSSGGNATRLTVHESLDAFPRYSPDGRWIAFSSLRTGNYDIFIVPAQGGPVRQVTYHSAGDIVSDWSPDGTKILFMSARESNVLGVFSIDLRTRVVTKLSHDQQSLRYPVWSPDGKSIASTRDGQPWWRPWYRGSVAASTVCTELATGKMKRPVKTNGQQFWPLYAPDGKSLFITMIYGESNTPNLWRVPLEGGRPVPVTKYTEGAVRFPQIARNGSLLVYLQNGILYTVKPDGSDQKALSVTAPSDDKVNNQERVTLNQEASEVELAADGRQIAFVVRGDVWTIPITGGDAKRLTNDPANDHDINWSPDGSKIALISDRGNQTDVYVLEVKTKAITRLTNDTDVESAVTWSPDGKYISFAKAGAQAGLYVVASGGGAPRKLTDGNGNNNFRDGITTHTWSPDSRWIAFSRMDIHENRDIWVVPVVGGTPVNVTRYPGDNLEPRFTRDGRKLLFTSDRSGLNTFVYQIPLEEEDDPAEERDENNKPKPRPDRSKDVKIDFEDIHLRARLAMPPIGSVTEYALLPDGNRIVARIGNNFWTLPLAPGPIPIIQMTSNGEPGGGIRIHPDGTKMYYLGANGTIRSLGIGLGGVSVVPFTASLVFDRREQYRQAFDEFTRRFGAAFYDEKMHGVNWKLLRNRYEPYLMGVGTPEEFAFLLSQMVGEVNSSHSEISSNSRFGGSTTATLGLTYDETYEGPGLKVVRVLPKGPADKPSTRITPGSYILSVDGTDVRLTEDYYLTLQDKVGKVVEVLVNSKPTKDGARTLRMRPMHPAQRDALDEEARLRKTRERVNRLADNRLAYAHIGGMEAGELRQFLREIEGDALSKEGLILDIRGNNGGSKDVNQIILDTLARKLYGYTRPRDGLRQTQPERVWNRPVVLLTDEHSVSAAELFPAAFRALNIGKIVGVATPGYVIGTYGGQLVDGTQFRLPSWAFYNLSGKNLENLGVAPDIVVENTLEDIAAGRDRQLEVAVQTLLNMLPSGSDRPSAIVEGGNVSLNPANSNPNGGSSAVRPSGEKNGKTQSKPE